jgi:hypothetical protein
VDKLVLIDTRANPDTQQDNLAPDISVYATDNIPDANAKTNFSKMELFVELKFAETSDPFRDPKEPQAKSFRFKNDSDVSQLNCSQLCSYATAHAGLSFASTPSPYLFADDLQDSFVGIVVAQLLLGALTTSKIRISLHTFSGVTHISIIANADTTLPSHQQIQHVEKCL